MARREEVRAVETAAGSVYDNKGYWYVKARLPGSKVRRSYPLKAPGAAHAMRSDCPVEMARDAAHRRSDAFADGKAGVAGPEALWVEAVAPGFGLPASATPSPFFPSPHPPISTLSPPP